MIPKTIYIAGIATMAALFGCKGKNKPQQVQIFNMDSLAREASVHETETNNYTTIHWIDSTLNFGTVKKGKLVALTYHFTNSGDKPLYITNVQPGCGCTVADYTKSAILPGRQGEVSAKYDSNHGVAGSVTKTIIVSSNTRNSPNFVLSFRGEITDPK